MANKSSSSIKKSSAAAASTAALMLLNADGALAFQPSFLAPSARMVHASPSFSSGIAPATVTMNCAPWDVECYGENPFGYRRPEGGRMGGRRGGGRGGGGRNMQRRRQFGPMVFPPPEVFQNRQMQVRDPAVIVDTDDIYTLSFDLPVGVNRDGLDVSVSDRLLTVKALVTHEEWPRPTRSRGGWVTRSSRTDSVSRSFVLPEGVSASSASVSLSADGNKAEVKFTKDKTAGGATTPTTTEPVASAAGTTTATADSPVSSATPSANAVPGTADSPVADDKTASSASSATDGAEASGSSAPRSPSSAESAFEAMDRDFREFAKAVWGQEVLPGLRVPTEEEWAEQAAAARDAWAKSEAEFAERAKAAKEARAKRVTAMRRATMAADMSQAEDGSSYVVRIALPEGTTRDNVKLSVNPDRSLRVTASAAAAEGAPDRSVYKDVFLPKDALLSNVSAKFEAEQLQGGDKKDEGASTKDAGTGAVSGLEVTVGRVAPPEPQSINIL